MSAQDVLFTIASLAAVGSTVCAVSRRNPVYSAAWMLVSLFSVAVIYLLLSATFLFVIQILLYAGAILVLFVFVIMLLNPGPQDLDADATPPWVQWAAIAFALLLFVGLARAIASSEAATEPAFTAAGARQPEPADWGTTEWVGRTLYDRYLVPFEMISVLILAAIAAVIMLAKRRLEGGGGPEGAEATAEAAKAGGDGHGEAQPPGRGEIPAPLAARARPEPVATAGRGH